MWFDLILVGLIGLIIVPLWRNQMLYIMTYHDLDIILFYQSVYFNWGYNKVMFRSCYM